MEDLSIPFRMEICGGIASERAERSFPVLIVDGHKEDFASDSAIKDRWRRIVHAHVLRLTGSTPEVRGAGNDFA